MPWRAFPWDPAAPLGERFSPSYVHAHQGSGRFDLPPPDGPVLYLAETADHAVAEKLQRYRGQRLQRFELREWGQPLALVQCTITSAVLAKVADLCDPRVLVTHDIAPDALASRELARTQTIAKRLREAGYEGLRWWSMLSGDWHTLVLFLHQHPPTSTILHHLTFSEPETLTPTHPAVTAAAAALGLRFS